jgi:hypothetical protein
MPKVWMASYKATPKGLKNALINKGIQWACKGIYSHCEIVLGDSPYTEPSECISASGMDGGVRLKTMKLNPDHWDLIELDLAPKKVEEWLRNNIGKRYDYLGATRFVLPFFLREHPNKWFCSEACADIIGFSEPWRFDPCSLYVSAKGINNAN